MFAKKPLGITVSILGHALEGADGLTACPPWLANGGEMLEGVVSGSLRLVGEGKKEIRPEAFAPGEPRASLGAEPASGVTFSWVREGTSCGGSRDWILDSRWQDRGLLCHGDLLIWAVTVKHGRHVTCVG